MDQKQVDLLLYMAHENNNQISKDFIEALNLNPDDEEIIDFVAEHNISFVDVWSGFDVSDKLTMEQEYILVLRAQKGDSQALNTLMLCFYEYIKKSAVSTIKKESVLYNASYDENDLAHEGVMAIAKAVQKFDVYKCNRFSTYVSFWATAAFNALIYGTDILKIPRNRKGEIMRIRQAKEECIEERISPTNENISQKTNIPVALVKKLRGYVDYINIQSLDATVETSYSGDYGKSLDLLNLGGTILGATADPTEYNSSVEDYVLYKRKYTELYRALEVLTDEEKELVSSRFGLNGEPLKLEELEERYGLSTYKIRKEIDNAINKVRLELVKNSDAIKE